jgi:hypothetical protein
MPATKLYGISGRNSTNAKSNPAINFRIGFTGLVNLLETGIAGLQLLDQGRNNGQRHEDGEEAGLHIDLRVSNFPEGEGGEEAWVERSWLVSIHYTRTNSMRSLEI